MVSGFRILLIYRLKFADLKRISGRTANSFLMLADRDIGNRL